MYERAQRMNLLHPAKLLVENWKKKDRIQYPTIMHHITTLQERCHLSNDRKPICRVPKIRPNKEIKSPEVITHLKNQDTNKKTDPALLKLEAEITILTYPPYWIHIYTDGSAFKATVNAGYGVYACFPDGTSKEIYGACGETCSNHEAETIGHAYITGNVKADILAKKGAQQQRPRKPITYTTARQIINHNYRKNWMNMWTMGQTGRVVYKYINSLKTNDHIRTISRKEQVTIFRLRTQHAPLNYRLNRINPQHPPMCPLCNDQFETTDHLLLHCPNLDDLRQDLLPPAPDITNITNILYSTTEQLKNTSKFYHMAMGRRANAHRLLD
ncbi:ribonuclease H [Elysia marginata]|uniref:Ribonuclease H n=1 Tax=Elysia marginata TaxID=1093978 RepID=A0AAV4J5F9_9GAST|nr:ribonuclease H [Elysia marginata]